MLFAWVATPSALGARFEAPRSHERTPTESWRREDAGSKGRWMSYHAGPGEIRDTKRATNFLSRDTPGGVLLEPANLGLLQRVYSFQYYLKSNYMPK